MAAQPGEDGPTAIMPFFRGTAQILMKTFRRYIHQQTSQQNSKKRVASAMGAKIWPSAAAASVETPWRKAQPRPGRSNRSWPKWRRRVSLTQGFMVIDK